MGLRFGAGVLLALLSVLCPASAQVVNEGWKALGKEQGVLISTRQLPGQQHPTFRGEATIKGSVTHVLAVVLDSSQSTKWVRGADSVEIVQADEAAQVVQMFTELPWPIRDRDTIMKRTIQVVTPGKEFRVRFTCAPKARKEKSGYLRVKTCDSHFSLKAADGNKTYVDYQVQLDPGGGLPSWGRRWMEKRITVDTLVKLERQVGRTVGKYASVMARYSP